MSAIPNQNSTIIENFQQRVLGYIESGKAAGAKVLTGGSRKGDKGYFIEPTVFTEATPDMKIVREEIFGPVTAVIKFKTEEEAIEHANNTDYGLSCQVFSQNISRAIRVAHALVAGQALVSLRTTTLGVRYPHTLFSTTDQWWRRRPWSTLWWRETVRLWERDGSTGARGVSGSSNAYERKLTLLLGLRQ